MAAATSGFLLGGTLDGKPDEDLGDEFEVDEEEISACTPTWRARCRVSEE